MPTETRLKLAEGTACLILGGSSLTTLAPDGSVEKHSFYPTNVEEFLGGILGGALGYGRLNKGKAGVLVLAGPGAFQNEGATVALVPSQHRVKDDAKQRGLSHFPLKQLLETRFREAGYAVHVFAYNDAVPALTAVMSQPNTEQVLSDFEQKLSSPSRSSYAVKYMINGTGTGEATLHPDTLELITAEKGHLKPNYLWYELNPFFKLATQLPLVGQNRSIERLIAGGPDLREARHFTKILNAVIAVLRDPQHSLNAGFCHLLGFSSLEELTAADGKAGILGLDLQTEGASSLRSLGNALGHGSILAQRLRNKLARALGVSLAHLHFCIGEMPDAPLHTFIGVHDIRPSALAFLRSDGSTTALFANSPECWVELNRGARDYAFALLGDRPHLLEVLDINSVFPNIHPDFGGLPELAASKLRA